MQKKKQNAATFHYQIKRTEVGKQVLAHIRLGPVRGCFIQILVHDKKRWGGLLSLLQCTPTLDVWCTHNRNAANAASAFEHVKVLLLFIFAFELVERVTAA